MRLGDSYEMINDNNRLIHKHEIIVDIITLINSNIINDIVNIIITKTINKHIVCNQQFYSNYLYQQSDIP